MPVRGQAPAWRKVMAKAFIPVRKLSITAQPPQALIESTRTPGSDNEFRLRIAPSPNLAVGPFQFKLRVDLITSDGKEFPGVTLPVAGDMQPEVRALPARLWFSGESVGETAHTTIVLQAPLSAHCVVDHVETESASVSVQAVDLERVPQGRAFIVQQHIEEEGDHENVIRFFLRTEQARDLETLTVRVCYHGQPRLPSPKITENKKGEIRGVGARRR